MKKIFWVITLVLCTTAVSYGQTKKEKKLKPVVDDVCDCLEKVKPNEDPGAKMEECMMLSMLSQLDVILDAYNLSVEDFDEEKGYEVGLDIGKQLARECPAFMELSIRMAEEDGDLDIDKLMAEEETEVQKASQGKVSAVTQEELVHIKLELPSGDIRDFVVFGNFAGSEKYIGDATTQIGKKVKIQYVEKEVYMVHSESFVTIKEIISITEL